MNHQNRHINYVNDQKIVGLMFGGAGNFDTSFLPSFLPSFLYNTYIYDSRADGRVALDGFVCHGAGEA